MNLLCSQCQGPITSRRSNAIFCSNACSRKSKLAKFKKENPDGGYGDLSPSRVGAIHEMMVCADLCKRGLSIFRAVSPSEECDIMAMRGSEIFRIEVTTGYRSPRGALNFPPKQTARFDILAVVERSGKITYHPDEPALISKKPAYKTKPKAGDLGSCITTIPYNAI